MASERSSYRKIQEVLSQAKSIRVESIEDLRIEMVTRDLSIFRTLQYDRDTDTMLPRVSKRVIRQNVKLCRDLDLLSAEGHLTDLGRAALRPAKFDETLVGQIRHKMKEQNISLSKLNSFIVKALHSNPPILPTAKTLWEESGGHMPKGLFTKFITLLSLCGCAQTAQNKIYLHIDTGGE